MKNFKDKDGANDIESIIVGPNASIHAYEDKDFKGTEITFAPATVYRILASSTWQTTSSP